MAQIIVENGTVAQKQFELSIEFITVMEGAYTFYAGTVYCPVELDVCPWKALAPFSFTFRRNFNWTEITSMEIHPYEEDYPAVNTDEIMGKVLAEIEGYEMKNN
jgi:uncharacterized protein CbrC (UPF0167 family)